MSKKIIFLFMIFSILQNIKANSFGGPYDLAGDIISKSSENDKDSIKGLIKNNAFVHVANRAEEWMIKEALLILLDHGADIDSTTYVAVQDCREGCKEIHSPEGITALMLSVMHGYYDVVKMLIEKGANINLKMPAGWSALMRAADVPQDARLDVPLDHVEQSKILELLLTSGAEIDAQCEQVPGMDIALVSLGSNGNAVIPSNNDRDLRGMTALMLAICRNNTGAVELLLKYGANTTIKNHAGKTAQDLAHETQNQDIIKLVDEHEILIRSFIDAVKELINLGPDPKLLCGDGGPCPHAPVEERELGAVWVYQ